MALLAPEDAVKRILSGLPAPATETVSIEDAFGRVLASDLAARLTQPPFAASAMDGYAVQARDARRGSRLEVIGVSQAGRGYGGDVGRSQAVRIFTGAPLPAGADTVVIQENVSRDGDLILIQEPVAVGANVRRAGIDFTLGQVVIRAGRLLDAHVVTLAAALGHGEVQVTRRPVVAILATGDELVLPGTVPGPDQIVSSNPIGVAALVREAGGVPHLLGIAGDTEAAIAAKVEDGRTADVLVTIGGASVGDHDLVGRVLKAHGIDLEFWKVAIRPGKPLLYGRLGATCVMGLPGNPVSALICARVFLMPLVRALAALPSLAPSRAEARLGVMLEANGPRLHLMRGVFSQDVNGQLTVAPLVSQDSSLLSSLAASNCLIVRAPNATACAPGDLVEIEKI
ncbi:MAG: gephyrin-like molybdotransferase Glp [Hyphomicrobium sp.]|jgi:molybdopterin molybdotransferase